MWVWTAHPQGLLLLLLLVVLAPQRQLLLDGVLELDVLEVVQVLHDVLVHRLGQVHHLQVFSQQLLQVRRALQLGLRVPCIVQICGFLKSLLSGLALRVPASSRLCSDLFWDAVLRQGRQRGAICWAVYLVPLYMCARQSREEMLRTCVGRAGLYVSL